MYEGKEKSEFALFKSFDLYVTPKAISNVANQQKTNFVQYVIMSCHTRSKASENSQLLSWINEIKKDICHNFSLFDWPKKNKQSNCFFSEHC